MDEKYLVEGQNLKKGVNYWLTGMHYPHYGKKIRLKKHVPAKQFCQGVRGNAAIAVMESGEQIFIYPKELVFSVEPPKKENVNE